MFQIFLIRPNSTNLELVGSSLSVENAWAFVDGMGPFYSMSCGEGSLLRVFSVTASEITR